MTTEDSAPETKAALDKAERLNANLAKVEELSKRLTAAMTHRRQVDPALHGPAPDVYMKAAAAYFAENATHWDEIRKLYLPEEAIERAIAASMVGNALTSAPVGRAFGSASSASHSVGALDG